MANNPKMSKGMTKSVDKAKSEVKEHRFGTIVAVIGSILIALGFAWLIAINWHQIPSFLKIAIMLFVTAGAYFLGVFLRVHNHPGIGKALLVLGALLYTLSIFLIAQIFSTDASLQGTAFLLLLAWVGVLVASYVFDSKASLSVTMIEFLIWIIIQYLAFIELFRSNSFALGGLALTFLAAGVLVYGLNLFHKSRNHKFAGAYQWWTALYFLLFAYVLSFQALLPWLWPGGFSFSGGELLFLSLFVIVSAVLFIFGVIIAMNKQMVSMKEIMIFVGVVLLFVLLIFSSVIVSNSTGTCRTQSCYSFNTQNECAQAGALNCEWAENGCRQLSCFNYRTQSECESASSSLNCQWNVRSNFGSCSGSTSLGRIGSGDMICNQHDNDRSSCLDSNLCSWNPNVNFFGRTGDVPFSLWAIWIFSNIIFILVILGVMGYGTRKGMPGMVNLGIAFFSLDILTRYLGFMFNFWGYTSLAIVFITGGVVLILGGWLITRWRKKLVVEAKEHQSMGSSR